MSQGEDLYIYFNEVDKNIWEFILEICLRFVFYIFLMVVNFYFLRMDLILGNF